MYLVFTKEINCKENQEIIPFNSLQDAINYDKQAEDKRYTLVIWKAQQRCLGTYQLRLSKLSEIEINIGPQKSLQGLLLG